MKLEINADALGERIVVLGRCVNLYGWRGTKCAAEFRGMTELLKACEIPYECDWDDAVQNMTAITIAGKRFAL